MRMRKDEPTVHGGRYRTKSTRMVYETMEGERIAVNLDTASYY